MSMVKVLIVDDQEPFRSAARMVVELTDGFEVVGEAENGEEGVEMASNLRPDLVLIDINMPGIDGLEATRQITAARPQTKVVVFSTYEPTEYLSRAKEAGAVDFIPKSEFDPTSLVSTWESASQ